MRKGYISGRSQARLDALEKRLRGTLQPFTPSQELVARVRSRIRIPDRAEIATRLRDWQSLMLVLGGVLSGAVMLITFVRALYHIFGRRGGA